MPLTHLASSQSSRHWPVFLAVLLLGLGITVYAYKAHLQQERQRHLDALVLQAKDYQSQLHRWLDIFTSINKGLAALFSASEYVTATEFSDYIQTAEPFSQLQGLNTLGYLQQAPTDYQATRNAYPLVHTLSSNSDEPGLGLPVGYDFSQNPSYNDAIDHALESGSGSAALLPQTGTEHFKQRSLIVFTPVYQPDRATAHPTADYRIVKGLIYSTLKLEQFFQGLNQHLGNDTFGIRFYQDQPDQQNLLYQDPDLADGKTRRLVLVYTGRLYFAGNRYAIEIFQQQPARVVSQLRDGSVVLSIGLVLSLATAFLGLRLYRQVGALANRSALAEQFNSFFRNHPFSVCSLDRQHRFIAVNPQMATELGVQAQELVGQSIDRFLSDDPTIARNSFDRAVNGQTMSFQCRIRRADGSEHDFAIVLIPLGSHGTVNSVLFIAENISERKRLEEKLFHQANHDGLTDLPNRAYFYAQLKQVLARHQRTPGRLALMYMDIDEFKAINDTYGHNVGDQVIRLFARRVRQVTRSSDVLARLGGDEFVLMLEDYASADDLEAIARKIVDCMQTPLQIDALNLKITTSIGIASATQDSNADTLVRKADHAMYAAKRSGRNQYRFAMNETQKTRETA